MRIAFIHLVLLALLSLASADVASWAISSTAPNTLLSATEHPEPSSPFKPSSNSSAYPTNQFWTNFILGDGSSPVVPLPYVVYIAGGGLSISYPEIETSMTHFTATTTADFVISTTEQLNAHRVVTYSELSVQLELPLFASASSSISFPLVRGSPYITAICTNATPLLTSIVPVVSINQHARGAEITDTRFLIQLEDSKLWVLYASEEVTLVFSDPTTFHLRSPLAGGALRLAYVPSSEMLFLLDKHASVYALSASVRYSVSDHNFASITFDFQVEGNATDTELFLLALPHHYDILYRPIVDPAPASYISYHSLKGEMRPVFGSEWVMHETLPDFDWYAQRAPAPAFTAALREALAVDARRLRADSVDPYWLGRELAAIARVALIADVLDEPDVARKCRNFIADKLTRSLHSLTTDALLYDQSWGGVVTRNSLYTPLADGGLGWYNDHLAAYGSLIFSAAVVNKANNSTWSDEVTPRVAELLIRDIANPSATLDAAFPVTRHKDWYEGHSWGLGLQHTKEGKSLASISEAAHAYYAVHLWALANNKAELADFASVLLAMELRAARRYWQAPSYRFVYDAVFSSNKFLLTYSSLSLTAAPDQLLTALTLQLRPVSPLLPFMLVRPMVQDSYVRLHNALLHNPDSSSALRAYGHLALAQLHADQSFADLASLTSFDYAETRTNVLYIAATNLPFSNSSLPRIPPVSPAESSAFTLSIDFAPASSTPTPPFVLDSGAAFTEQRGYGWLGLDSDDESSSKIIESVSLPTSGAWDPYVSSFARFRKPLRWKALVPTSGEYYVTIVVLRDKKESGCDTLQVYDRDVMMATRVVANIEACPDENESTRVWSGVLSLDSGVFILSSQDSTNVASIQLYSVNGAYLDITFKNDKAKRRDSIGVLPGPDPDLVRSAIAGVTAHPPDRFYVRAVSGYRASVVVLDSRNFPGTDTSANIAITAQRAPVSLWLKQGVAVTSVVISAFPFTPTNPPPNQVKPRYHIPTFVVVLSAVLGSFFILGSLAAIVYLLRRRSDEAQFQMQEFANVSLHSNPPSAQNSQVDLLRTPPRSRANISTTPTPPSPTVGTMHKG